MMLEIRCFNAAVAQQRRGVIAQPIPHLRMADDCGHAG
jgi:hypothetical protein